MVFGMVKGASLASIDSESGGRTSADDNLPVGASPGTRQPYRVDMGESEGGEHSNESSLGSAGRHSEAGSDGTNKPGTAKFLQYTERHLTSELLFCCSTGNLRRLKRVLEQANKSTTSESYADYDNRTPLHVAASEGSFKVADWLVKSGVPVNPVDRWGSTPLESAVYGNHGDLVKMLAKNGGKIKDRVSGTFLPLEESHLSGAAHMQLPVDTMAWEIPDGEFSNVEEIGAGAFGVVYSGTWRGTKVCLKQLHKHLNADEVAQAEFRLELKIMQQLHHPHIVQFLGTTVSAEGLTSIVSEYMAGGSLETLFRAEELLPLRQSLKMALDCARGMAYLHGRTPLPVIHRDLKPGNLMLTKMRTLKIGDFGLSKTLSVRNKLPQEMSQAFNMTGETGSYRYMAPEVFRHEFYGPAVDVYAASMIYYQLFSFQQPFSGRNPVDACRAASLENLRPPIRGGFMPDELSTLVTRMWDPLVKKRPDFLEIITVLEPLAEKYADSPDKQPGCGCVVS